MAKPDGQLSICIKEWLAFKQALLEGAGFPRFACPDCGRVSYNAGDIANRFCGACKKFFAA